jgi:dUTP pyrophosphatase
MDTTTIQIRNTSDLPLPQYQTDGAAGFDFVAAIDEPIILAPGERHAVPTGLYIALPTGFELQLRARSGLAFKFGIGLVNGVGTIDTDYRGEIKVLLINHGHEPFTINHGDRIAQGIISRYERITWKPVDALDETDRGHGGFGSTGH